MNNTTNILIDKLNSFIRKYYKNQLLRGSILVVGGIISAFLIASTLEHFGHFNSNVRLTLFLNVAIFCLTIFVAWIVIPLMKLYHLGKTINHEQAAEIIGNHFSEIGDKLINTLQLSDTIDGNSLLQAAVAQKTKELKPIPFQNAIDFTTNKKYLKFALVPLSVFLLMVFINKDFTDSTKRVVQYNKQFVQQAPFEFQLDLDDLNVLQNTEVIIGLKTQGKVIPNEAYISIEGNDFKMQKKANGIFTYKIKRLSNDAQFFFKANGFNSQDYQLHVIPKPSLLAFETSLKYPAYTGLKNESLKNVSEISVPAGTEITWNLQTKNVSEVQFVTENETETSGKNGSFFKFSKRVLHPKRYVIHTKNSDVTSGDSMEYSIQVIPDTYPEITMETKSDSSNKSTMYMVGQIRDDYGFKKLLFHYRFVNSKDEGKKLKTGEEVIDINPKNLKQGFYYLWDLNALNITAEDKLEYYFEVWDNDAVNGSKSTKTQPQVFEAPSLKAINEATEKNTEKIKDEISESKKDAENLKKDIDELQQRLTQKKELTWEDKKKIKDLLKSHEELEKQLQSVVEQNTENNTNEKQFKKIDQQIMDKQQQIEELFDEVVNDEMKKLMEKIEDMMNNNQKEEMMQQLEQLQMTDQDVQKQLDRMLEQLKQLQLEKKVNETTEKLSELAKEQEELSKESEKGEKTAEELKKEQEKLSEKFEDVKKDLEDIDKKNQDLETPLDLDPKKMEEEKNKVDSEQSESEKNLGKNQKSKAGQNQKNASEEMKKMEQELAQQMEAAMKEQQMEDYNTLRGILDNLVQLSKDQEELMKDFGETQVYNPKYVALGQQQKKIRDDAKIIEDSLFALSKRVQQVEHFINKEIGLVNSNIGKAIEQLGERNTYRVMTHQQYVMTSMNNLALMLESSLEQMQQQMQSKPGSGSCSKPGQNKKPGGAKSLKEMQESLQKQLEQMGKQQQGGEKPSSMQFAKAAAQQAAIRKKLKELQKQLEKEGNGQKLGNLGKTEKMMDDLENDLYNKRMNQNVLNRQKEILTRLLEHEKAEQKQEQDNKRKSNEGQDLKREIPPSIEEYLKQQNNEQELLKTLPPNLTPYYKNKTREYFQGIDQ